MAAVKLDVIAIRFGTMRRRLCSVDYNSHVADRIYYHIVIAKKKPVITYGFIDL